MSPSTAGLSAFLFTDIEGSSLRWLNHRAAMEQAVARHDEKIRAVVAEHSGEIFKAVGDAFYAAFARPADAVNAAVAAQRVLGAEDWSAVDGLKVRMAVHVGSAEKRGNDFFGPALNRTARLIELAHGGQILVTASTAELLAAERDVAATFLRVGENPLDDPAQFVGIHQVIASGLLRDFPPFRKSRFHDGELAAAGSGFRLGTRSRGRVIAAGIVVAVLLAGGFAWLRKERAPAVPLAATASAPAASPAGQLANQALALYERTGFTRDDLAVGEDLTRRATELEPTLAQAWGVRAGVSSAYVFRTWDQSEKRRQETEAFAKRALALNPDEPEALLALGRILVIQGAGSQAEIYLRRAMALRPEEIRVRSALVSALLSQNRISEARVVAEEAVQSSPRDPLLRYNLANTYIFENPPNPTTALEQLNAALALGYFAGAHLQKARLLGCRGDLAGMRAELDQLLPKDRIEERAVYLAMWAALLERKPERVREAAALTAKIYFTEQMVVGPKATLTALSYQMEGKDALARGQWQNVESVLRQRLREEPANLEDRAMLGLALAWQGRGDEAALEIAPVELAAREETRYFPSVRLGGLLAQYYAARGDAAAAVPYIRKVIERNYWVSAALLPIDPLWDRIRDKAEFIALLEEMKPKTAGSSK